MMSRPERMTAAKTGQHTHAPTRSFSIARSTAGWYMLAPRKVSMTCPLRKKAEKTLKLFLFWGEASEGIREKGRGKRARALRVREHDV